MSHIAFSTKVLIAVALVLSIALPFAGFLMDRKAKKKRAQKRAEQKSQKEQS